MDRSSRSGADVGHETCPHFPDCVGCPLIGTPYARQLAAKQERLRHALAAREELVDLSPEEPVGSDARVGYRNQAKLVFRARRGKAGQREVLLGVYRPGTHSVAPADRCIVHHPALRPVLAALRREVEALGIPIFDERSRRGALRYALARCAAATGEVHLTLVSAVPDPPGIATLIERLHAGHPGLAATFLCVNATPGNTILGPDIRCVRGPAALLERFGTVLLESRPDAFLQANSAVATRIYETVEAWLAPTSEECAVDLYCGVGALALRLAPRLARVLGIEASAAAVACARVNAARAGVPRATFVPAPVEDALAVATRQEMPRPDLATLNPPRRGLTAEAFAAVVGLRPGRIAYVSCEPVSLARDLAAFVRAGYRIRRIRAFDMLPQTPHVEAVTLLVDSARCRPFAATAPSLP